MSTLPQVTILLPFRNEAAFLAECLDSIQAQTFGDFTLLAIDDASTDDSADIVQKYTRSDKRIQLISNPRQGLVNALNHGLGITQTPLIARMDGDDHMHPQRLEKQVEYMQANPDIDLVGCCVVLFPEEEIDAGYREYIRWQNQCLTPADIGADIYIESPLAHPSVLFRSQAVKQVGGYRQGLFPEDYDLWLRLLHAGHRMAKLPDTLLYWRERPDRTSRVDPRCSREAFDQLRARYLAQDPRFLPHSKNFAVWGAGRKTRKRCQHLLKQGYEPQAWIDIDPKKIGNRLQGAPVVSPDWLRQNPGTFVLGYVANHGARDLIQRELHKMGYQRERDYLMVG